MEFAELEQYVAEHPDDYDQRWRLAKQLYMACEYRPALNHLRALQRCRPDQMNVSRYLAATYYRLGMYDEAEDELRTALSRRPDEIPLERQLARVLERAGRREEAAMVWERILAVAPDIPGGRETLDRLLSPPGANADARLGLTESNSGISLKPGVVCPGCGAYNDESNEACWQCGSRFLNDDSATPLPEPAPPAPAVAVSGPWLRTLICGMAAVTFLTLGVYLTLDVAASSSDEAMLFSRMPTVQHFVHRELLLPRLCTGLVLLVGWPGAIWLAARTLGRRRMAGADIVLIGVLLASGSYALFWAPLHLMPFAQLLPAIGSLVVIVLASNLTFTQAVRVWIIQGVVVLLLAAGTFAAFEGVYPFSQLPAAIEYSSEAYAAQTESAASSDTLPVFVQLDFEPSGSRWLDALCATVGVEVTVDQRDSPVLVELRHGGRTLYRATITEPTHRFVFEANTHATYTIAILGAERSPTTVRVRSALRPTLKL